MLTFDHQPTSVTLSWPPLVTQTLDTFTYEIGYITTRTDNTQCTTTTNGIDVSTLPEGYTLFDNTTGNSTVVTSLQPGTCYMFGVRVYSQQFKTDEWRVGISSTLTLGMGNYVTITYTHLLK